MIILGIDPALSNLGWGLIQNDQDRLKYIASGTIKTTSATPIHQRLAMLSLRLEELITAYQPDLVAMEETFINKNAVSSLALGYARGAIMALIGRHGLPLQEYKPNTVKKTVVGVGHAEKSQVLHMVRLLINGASLVQNLDESDALAIAYTCSVGNRLKNCHPEFVSGS